MKAIDLTKILKGYTSGWVAISSDYKKIVAWAPDYTKLNLKLKKLGKPKVVLLPCMKNYGSIIG